MSEDVKWGERITELRAERRAKVLELRGEDMPLRAIADALGVSHATVLRDLVSDDDAPAASATEPNGGKPMTTTETTAAAPAGDDLAEVRKRLQEAEDKAKQLEAQLEARPGIQPQGTRNRMPTERLRSGALPDGAEASSEPNYGEVADKILRGYRGY